MEFHNLLQSWLITTASLMQGKCINIESILSSKEVSGELGGGGEETL